ncbi:sensor histidine kinase [Extibacter muris]|uniref:histidine kinase n=2 Tax=Extibacter muris TaxID=1796622 RepID=A0A4R4FBT2_9FIRM|nr:HAMP domain-containing sensor histidine kinase [Extibacter muris]MCU0081152.1 HAMP domain-containing histidine kinase [Extibacter muris]TDA20149.1 HAMP domain-containing histidine kinase [Extibacter muris]
MTQVMNKKDSIYAQLLRLLLISAFAAFVVFCGLNYAGEYLVEGYLEKTDYIKQKNQDYVEKLQKYIDKEQLSSRDVAKLNVWTKSQKVLSIRIYKDEIQVFNSEYPEQEVWEEEIAAGNYAWEQYYNIRFSDGTAEIEMTGIYYYQFYNYALITEIIISFFLFLLLVLLGIRKKIEYIRKLNDEIQILEGGGLDYEITVKGKDELAELGASLDTMRISFCNLIEQEKKMVQENQRIVTEMSHDLRTPVTSIMLYTEILKKGTYKNVEQEKEYIEKIDKKARRMKQLTDHLFEYSLITGETEVKLEDAESYEVLFYDLFSETCSYLEQKGFHSEFQVKWINQMICVSTEYMMRIMDNITSNIVKYADPSMPIIISSIEEEQMAGFIFENHIRMVGEKVESTEIGIQSIKTMMSKMGGKCRIEQENRLFRIILLFPIVSR